MVFLYSSPTSPTPKERGERLDLLVGSGRDLVSDTQVAPPVVGSNSSPAAAAQL